jgi:hypothetical protein
MQDYCKALQTKTIESLDRTRRTFIGTALRYALTRSRHPAIQKGEEWTFGC